MKIGRVSLIHQPGIVLLLYLTDIIKNTFIQLTAGITELSHLKITVEKYKIYSEAADLNSVNPDKSHSKEPVMYHLTHYSLSYQGSPAYCHFLICLQ